MRYFRVAGSDGSRLAVETSQAAYDLTGVEITVEPIGSPHNTVVTV
jgi:hypothetical protein